MVTWSLYTAPEELITADLLRSFLEAQQEARLLTESMTLELKERRTGDNIAKAVAGFANSEGGVVLVGVSDDSQTFDSAPGVPPSEVVAIIDSCRNLLTPMVNTSIVPVPLPNGENVVIVVRVDPDPSLQPVCKAGTIFVRAPGQTVPASRDQIIALASRSRGAKAGTTHGMSLQSTFAPQYDGDATETRDALVRVAGGVWLRPSASDFVFNSARRDSVLTLLQQSPFVLLPALNRFQWRRPENRPQCAVDSFTASTATFKVEYADGDALYRVSAQFRRDGYRISYVLDMELRVRAEKDPNADPRLGREELAAILLAGLQTVAIVLPDSVATLAVSAPQFLEPVYVWVQNQSLPFDTLLDLSRTNRASANSVGSQWGFEVPVPRTTEEVAAAVRTQIEHLYLDLGLYDSELVAEEDVRRGLAELENVVREVRV